jgi:hypothetical protein
MTLLRQSVLVLAVSMVIGEAAACTSPFPSKEHAREGRNVIIGVALSSARVARPAGAPAIGIASSNSMSLAAPELLVRVQVLEVIHGKAPATVTAVSPCHLPLKPGERVLVATYSGRRAVYPADWYEQSFRTVYRSAR